MVAAITADVKIGLELSVEQHLFAARAFVPEVVRHRVPAHRRPDFWQDKICEPAHRRLLTCRIVLVEYSARLCSSPFRYAGSFPLRLPGERRVSGRIAKRDWRGNRCCGGHGRA